MEVSGNFNATEPTAVWVLWNTEKSLIACSIGYEKSEGSVSDFEPETYRVRSSGNHS